MIKDVQNQQKHRKTKGFVTKLLKNGHGKIGGVYFKGI